MTVLRIITLAAWLTVLTVMVPAVWSILRGRPRASDPARLVCFGYAFTAIGFSGRWLVMPTDTDFWAALYVLSIAVAIYTLHAARSYGRGPRV